MFFRLTMVVLWVACAENSKVELDQNAGDGDARVAPASNEPTSTGNNDNNTAVSISLNNLPKGLTTETSINVSVTSTDGAKSYRYAVIAATSTDDGTVACKAATYSNSTALSNNIAESNLAVGKHRLCVKAENAAGEAEDYPTVFEWEVVSQLPSTSPCSPCTVGCTGWAYSSWTPSQALHCSTDSVKQIAASIRTCDSQCSECSTGSTLTRTVDGTNDCSPPQVAEAQQTPSSPQPPATPTCTSCSAGCTDWSYAAWTPSAANTCSDTQLQQTAAGTRTCDSECSQCNTSTSKTRSINGTKNCSTPTCASCSAGCTAWSYAAWTPSAANTCSGTQLTQTAAGTRTCDSECSQCSTSTSKSQVVDGTKYCPKHAVLIPPAGFDSDSFDRVDSYKISYSYSNSNCDDLVDIDKSSFVQQASKTIVTPALDKNGREQWWHGSVKHLVKTGKYQLSPNPLVGKDNCSKATINSWLKNGQWRGKFNLDLNLYYPGGILCALRDDRGDERDELVFTAASVRWDAATNTCHIMTKWKN